MLQLQLIVGALLISATIAVPVGRNEDVYDQRQNGTENYRINVDGVVVAIAPAESLMASSSDLEDFLNLLDYDENLFLKPTTSTEGGDKKTTTEQPELVSSTEKPTNALKKYGFKRRLANFILPILRRNRQQ